MKEHHAGWTTGRVASGISMALLGLVLSVNAHADRPGGKAPGVVLSDCFFDSDGARYCRVNHQPQIVRVYDAVVPEPRHHHRQRVRPAGTTVVIERYEVIVPAERRHRYGRDYRGNRHRGGRWSNRRGYDVPAAYEAPVAYAVPVREARTNVVGGLVGEQ